jgi:hypothetical protein
MNDEEQVPQAGTPAAAADAEKTPVERLEALGVRGILWQVARDGQIVDVRCEMPSCYCFRGRRYFEPISPGADWMPTADHYPRLKMHGGRLTPDNVRLAHRLCNQRDYILRVSSTRCSGSGCRWRRSPRSSTPRRFQRFTARTDGQLHLFGRHSFPKSAFRTPSRRAAWTLSPPGAGCLKTAPRSRIASRDIAPALPPDPGVRKRRPRAVASDEPRASVPSSAHHRLRLLAGVAIPSSSGLEDSMQRSTPTRPGLRRPRKSAACRPRRKYTPRRL